MWKTDVDWLLPGATLHQVRDLADPCWPSGPRQGQLAAIMIDHHQLKAQIVDRSPNRAAPVLQARLVPDDRGLLIQGRIGRTDRVNRAVWLGFVAVIAGVVIVQGPGSGPAAMLSGLAFLTGFGALTPGLWKHTGRNQQHETERLKAALLERFAVDG